MRILAIASALLLANIAPAVAHAEDLVIQYRDLDLNQPKDRKILNQRIESAVRSYCGANDVMTGTRVRSNREGDCVREARSAAKEQFDALIARHVAKSGS